MGIVSYEKNLGRLEILKMCNYDLKDVRQHLIRECNLPKGYDLSKAMKIYKTLLVNTTVSKSEKLICEYFNKIGEETYDN